MSKRIVEDSRGASVFEGTRIDVLGVGRLARSGRPMAEIIAAFPMLDEADLANAWSYAEEVDALCEKRGCPSMQEWGEGGYGSTPDGWVEVTVGSGHSLLLCPEHGAAIEALARAILDEMDADMARLAGMQRKAKP